MILYSVYFVLLSMFLLDIGSYFDSVFKVMGVGVGMRTAAIQCATLIVVGLIIVNRRADKVVWRELLVIMGVWAPILLYLALRVDSDNSYSELKFAKIVAIAFLGTATVTITYLCDARTFTQLLPIVIIVLSVLLGVEALMHPQQFKYRSEIDRMTIEGMNPIWLARSFAIAGACLFLFSTQSNIVKLLGIILVIIGILPTGSRGPLISLILTLSVWFVVQSDRARVRLVITTVAASVLVILAFLFAGDRIETAVNSYFSRGQHQGFVEESGRPQLFSMAANDFLSAPIVGVGLGAFGKSSGHFSKTFPGKRSSKQGLYPHNIVLEILAEVGVLGMILTVIAMRPGKWLVDLRNPYFYLFLLTFLFSMSSGDITANIGVIIFGTLARLTSQYSLSEAIQIDYEMPKVESIT